VSPRGLLKTRQTGPIKSCLTSLTAIDHSCFNTGAVPSGCSLRARRAWGGADEHVATGVRAGPRTARSNPGGVPRHHVVPLRGRTGRRFGVGAVVNGRMPRWSGTSVNALALIAQLAPQAGGGAPRAVPAPIARHAGATVHSAGVSWRCSLSKQIDGSRKDVGQRHCSCHDA
jgi:hypothetical protein